jgi:Secretion system C-terminal sorting domain
MIRFRIQLSRVSTLMTVFVLSGIVALSPASVNAQICSGSLGSITYDTVVSESTSGGGNATGGFSYTIPQFSMVSATLYKAEIKSTVITASLTATMINLSGSAASPIVNLYRTDGVTSTAIPNGSGFNFSSPYTGTLTANNTLEAVPMPNAITNQTVLDDSVKDAVSMANLSGVGTVKFNYSGTDQPLGNSGFYAVATSGTDQVSFSITYYYCQIILPINLVSFTATLENPHTVQLNWTSANEEANRTYNVQVSTDGTNFSDVGSVQSDPVNTNASYTYNYPVSPTATGRLFFRLRMVDNNGAITFSSICLVNLNGSNTTAFSIYPNPATDFINLVLPGGNQSWNVDIIAADGNLVQRNIFSNTALGRIDFTRKLARGTYFVRATNTTSGEQHGGSFVIPQ